MPPRKRHHPEHPAADRPWSVETASIKSVAEDDRHGTSRELLWVWLGANIGIAGIMYGAILTTLGLSLWPGAAAVVGTILSFGLVGVLGVAGKWGGAPMLGLSRVPFGQGQPRTDARELDQSARLGGCDRGHRRVRFAYATRDGLACSAQEDLDARLAARGRDGRTAARPARPSPSRDCSEARGSTGKESRGHEPHRGSMRRPRTAHLSYKTSVRR